MSDGSDVETRKLHLLADEHGDFPIGDLNPSEVRVVDKELARDDILGWYRNPSCGSEDALAIAYRNEHQEWRRLCPDFIFFHGSKGNVKVSIVDPHGFHLADSLPKLRGSALYAASRGDAFMRIDAITELADKAKTLRVLDLQEEEVRRAVDEAVGAEALYRSDFASDF